MVRNVIDSVKATMQSAMVTEMLNAMTAQIQNGELATLVYNHENVYCRFLRNMKSAETHTALARRIVYRVEVSIAPLFFGPEYRPELNELLFAYAKNLDKVVYLLVEKYQNPDSLTDCFLDAICRNLKLTLEA